MEYVLRAELFDYELADKVLEVVLPDINQLEKESHYKIVVNFNVDLLNDPRMDLVEVPLKKWEKNDSRKDKIYNLLSFQIKKIDEAFCGCDLEITDATIQGEQLEDPDIIMIQLTQKVIEPVTSSKKKKTKSIKVTNVVPDLHFIQDTASKLANDKLSKIYIDLMKGIRNKRIMSEILEIEPTEDNDVLYGAFFKQYRDLWLPTEDQRKTLVNKLTERIEIVINKHSDQDIHEN